MEVEVAFMSRNVGLPDESDSESESDGARRSDSHESSSPPPTLFLSPSAMQAPSEAPSCWRARRLRRTST